MARWRLTGPHYLKVPDIEWEYKEISRESGRQARKIFKVPLLLNPNDPADYNYPGEIVVCHEGKGQHRDIIFTGPPTPEMEPLDAEAEALTEAERKNWSHPIESLDSGGYADALIKSFERQMQEIAKNLVPQSPQTQSLAGISRDEFEELKKQMAQLMERNAQLEAKAVHEKLEKEDDEPGPVEIVQPVKPKHAASANRR